MNQQQQPEVWTQSVKIAPGPESTNNYKAWLLFGGLLALPVLGALLPEPIRDALLWPKATPLFLFINKNAVLPFVVECLAFAIFIAPFSNWLPRTVPFNTRSKWAKLTQLRQEAADNRFRPWDMVLAPVPEVFSTLPTSLSLQVQRNKRATWIAGTIYALLIGFVLWQFAWAWQINLQYLIQRGAFSAWTLPGTVLQAGLCCLVILPAPLTFLLVPRQRLIATQEGLLCSHGLRLRFIPWREAALFALIAERKGTLIYELASSTCLMRWASKPAIDNGEEFPPGTIGVAPFNLIQAEHSTEDYQWQARQLTAMVAASVGLPLYDLREPQKPR